MKNATIGEEAIFKVACQISTGEAREAYLKQVCGDNVELRRRLETLIRAYLSQPGFLEPAGTPIDCTVDMPAVDLQPGTQVGPWKLCELLAEGGMGVVYVAEQSEPVRRKVALKIIRPGLSTKNVLARFEAERQALALMDHPNIARVIDGGVTDFGLPYFVMELVQGLPLTEYCDQKRLSTVDRLKLFIKVCRAVQHAHQKGIIHRDLKPSNVLVAEIDNEAVPKVIDFGIARAIDRKPGDESIYTQFSQMIGTPLYMSPEQASLGVSDIDTRSDVYSLGVLLYELLTGRTPFDRLNFRDQGLDEFRRVLREEDPKRPSAAISTLNAEQRSTISMRRSCEPDRLANVLRGELDWIVMKAIEKDRARRYESANDFAVDIQRFLAGDAIEAHPPGVWYRLLKTWNKHRAILTSACLIAVSLVAGLTGTTVGLVRARSAEAEANDRATALAEKARELQQVADYQKGIVDSIDPAQAGQWLREIASEELESVLAVADLSEARRADRFEEFSESLREVNMTDLAARFVDLTILRPAMTAIGEQFADQPTVAAVLLQSLAQRYETLGESKEAIVIQEQAVERLVDALGEDHRDALNARSRLGECYRQGGRLRDADDLLRIVLARQRELFDEKDPDAIRSLQRLVSTVTRGGDALEAESLAREGWKISQEVLGPGAPETLSFVADLGKALMRQAKLTEAEGYIREALTGRRKYLGERHRSTLHSMQNLAKILIDLGKYPEALEYCQLCLDRFPSTFGEFHSDTVIAFVTMGRLLEATNRVEAEEYYRSALERRRVALGQNAPETITLLTTLGRLLSDRGKVNEALEYLREARQTSELVYGPDHPGTIDILEHLGNAYIAQKNAVQAESTYRDLVSARLRTLGPDNGGTIMAMRRLILSLEFQEKTHEAAEYLRQIVDHERDSLADAIANGAENQQPAHFRMSLAKDLVRLAHVSALESNGDSTGEEDLREAEELLRPLLESPEVDRSGIEGQLKDYYFLLAEACRDLSRYEQARAAYEKSLEILPNDPMTTAWIAEVLLVHFPPPCQDAARAEQIAELTLELDPEFSRTRYWLALARFRQGKFTEAEPLFASLLEGENNDINRSYLGITCYRLGEIDRAKQVLQKLSVRQPAGDTSLATEYLLGQALFNVEEYEEAISTFSAVIDAMENYASSSEPQPESIEFLALLHLSCGKSLQELKRVQEAVGHFERANQLLTSLHSEGSAESAEELSELLNLQTGCYMELHSAKDALRCLDQQAELSEDGLTGPMELLRQLLRAYVAAGDEDYREAVRIADEYWMRSVDARPDAGWVGSWEFAAIAYSRSAAAVFKDQSLTEAERQELSEAYSLRAIDVLRFILTDPEFSREPARSEIVNNEEYDNLRKRDDFRHMIDGQ